MWEKQTISEALLYPDLSDVLDTIYLGHDSTMVLALPLMTKGYVFKIATHCRCIPGACGLAQGLDLRDPASTQDLAPHGLDFGGEWLEEALNNWAFTPPDIKVCLKTALAITK